MPRPARRDLDGPAHHVIIKGHNGEPIVSNDDDRHALARGLASAFTSVGLITWAWSLLTTHGHFFIPGLIRDVSAAIARALGPYAQRRNAVLRRSGRVVNGRFWSRPVHEDDDAVNLGLYVDLNPLKAGIVSTVDELSEYRWCSLGNVLAGEPSVIPVDTAGALAFYGSTEAEARRILRQCLDDRVERWREDCGMRSLPAIIRVVAARHGLPPDTLTDGTRGRWWTSARRDVVLEARARGHSNDVIARALGISRVAVWKLVA